MASDRRLREGSKPRQRWVNDIRAGSLFSEEEKEDVTMDLMLAMAPLPGLEEETAVGAIAKNWRQGCRGAQERKGKERGGGEKRGGRRTGIYANPCPFHRDRTAFFPTNLARNGVGLREEAVSRGHHLSDPHTSDPEFAVMVQSPTIPPTVLAAPPPLLHAGQRWTKHRVLTEILRDSYRIWACLA